MKKYLHIINQESEIFMKDIIKMINEEFKMEEINFFMTTDRNLYESCSTYENVEYIEKEELVKYINQEYKNYDYILVHSMNFTFKQLIKIKKASMKKTIWGIWGHDLYYKNTNIKDKIKIFVKKKIFSNLYGVGLGFKYDIIEVKKIVGENPHIFYLPYGYEKGSTEKNIKIYSEIKEDKNYYRIMIGHCGFKFINHIEIMKKLLKYKEENIKISLVLAYGENDYIEEVKKFALQNFEENKIEIIDNLMSKNEYFKYLKSVDIAIFDYKNQAGLGNIAKLAYLEKKIFLKESGIIKLAFDLEGLESYCVKDLDNMKYDEFITEIEEQEKEKLHNYGKLFISETTILNAWKKFFNNMEKEQ